MFFLPALAPVATAIGGLAARMIGMRVATAAVTRAAVPAAEMAASRLAAPAAELAVTAARGPAAQLATQAAERGVSVASMAGNAATAARTAATAGAEAAATAAAPVAAEVAGASLAAQTAARVATTGAGALGVGHVASEVVRAPFDGITQIIGKVAENAPQIAAVTGVALAGIAAFHGIKRLFGPSEASVAKAGKTVSSIMHDGTVLAPAVLKVVH